jgi:hypothetical protein
MYDFDFKKLSRLVQQRDETKKRSKFQRQFYLQWYVTIKTWSYVQYTQTLAIPYAQLYINNKWSLNSEQSNL